MAILAPVHPYLHLKVEQDVLMWTLFLFDLNIVSFFQDRLVATFFSESSVGTFFTSIKITEKCILRIAVHRSSKYYVYVVAAQPLH